MSTASSDGLATGDEFDLLVDAALQASVLATLPAAVMARLRLDALRSEIPAGRVLYRVGDQPRPALVVSGMVRLFLTTPEGREVNLAYARSGELIGVAGIIDGPSQVSAQAFTDTRLWRFGLSSMREVAATQPQLALALARQLLDRLYRVVVEVRGATFGSLRSRVARHLLDLAAEQQADHVEAGHHAGELVAPVTHQQLADAVGSVRQAVGRVLGKLHTDGLIEQTRHGVVVLDPEALRAEGWDGN
ncbi:MAG: Crp/Fnr family transcriptional regulator [Acidimicrobiales bacterium]